MVHPEPDNTPSDKLLSSSSSRYNALNCRRSGPYDGQYMIDGAAVCRISFSMAQVIQETKQEERAPDKLPHTCIDLYTSVQYGKPVKLDLCVVPKRYHLWGKCRGYQTYHFGDLGSLFIMVGDICSSGWIRTAANLSNPPPALPPWR